ncbi:MAG: formyltransferase family protein, partial [Burkholderiaceae bacterium]
TEALDHGPILAQAVVPVRDDDDEALLAARVLQAEHRLYPQVVCWMLEDRVSLHEGRMLIRGIDPSQRLIVMDLDRMQGNPE